MRGQSDLGTLALGDGTVSAIALIFFIALVACAHRTKSDIRAQRDIHAHHEPLPHAGPVPELRYEVDQRRRTFGRRCRAAVSLPSEIAPVRVT